MSLIKLPHELLFEVASHLHPKDIVTPLRTCRGLASCLHAALTDSIFRVRSPVVARRALFSAVQRLDKRRVKELLSRGIQVIAENQNGSDRLICEAMISESKEAVILLLECGLRTDVLDVQGNTVILYAAISQRWDLLELIFEWPGVLDGIEKLDKNEDAMGEALYAIISSEREDLSWKVLNLVNDNILRDRSFALLWLLIRTNRLGTFNKLIATNRLFLQDNREEGTILHHAVVYDSIPFIKTLLARPDIDVNVTDTAGRTPLHTAAEVSKEASTIRLLLADPRVLCNWRDNKGLTPLNTAAERGNLMAVQTLLEHPGCWGTTERLADYREAFHGNTPLHGAVVNCHFDIVKFLLAQPGFNDISFDANRYTPLHHAVETGDMDILRLLLKHYSQRGYTAAHIDRKNKLGSTPLHLAVFRSDYLIRELLLDGRFDVNSCGPDGKTPLQLAFEMPFNDVCKRMLLLDWRIDISTVENLYGHSFEEVLKSVRDEEMQALPYREH